MIERVRGRVSDLLPPDTVLSLSSLLHGESHLQRALRRRLRDARTAGSRARVGSAVTPVGSASAPLLALPVDRFSAQDVLTDNFELTTAALTAAAVPYALIDAPTMGRRLIAVDAVDADAARRALAERYRDDPVYVSRPTARGQTAPVLARAAATDRALRTASALRVFRVHAAGDIVLAAGELGCEIEFWRHQDSDDGTVLLPLQPNRRTALVRPAASGRVTTTVQGREHPTYRGLERKHLLDVHFPIDVVYTWVDGSDPEWLRRKGAAWEQTHPGRHHPFSANPSRFTSHGELRYSLRSLSMYAGWVRKVYIVTDRQVPPWLRTDHPGVQVVDHRDIFVEPDALPTFNSHAIETQLHHIDGLSEHFLYLNDDVFFGRPVRPELFFLGNGLARFFLSQQAIDLEDPTREDLPVVSAAKVNRSAMERRFDRTISHKLQHVPHPLRRSVLADVEQDLAEQVRSTAATPFRSHTDVSLASSLAHHYGYATGRAVPGELSYRYLDIADPRIGVRLRRLLRQRDADVFCLNDVNTDESRREAQERVIKSFLEAYYPVRSAFERPDVPPVTR